MILLVGMTKNKTQKKATIQGKVALLFSNIPYYNEFLKMICIGICVLVFLPSTTTDAAILPTSSKGLEITVIPPARISL